ncbi:MAG: thiamine-phosphate kinase [Flavobacteriales bacterium]|nr:thiamine-phosphate kinase [Flavobacteriales bacterium]MCW8912153.1 thiamine-phosphate kinase [Flavobacteriales bacterium]MCW8938038.1 thiamine-phosphate kinase [Flavobacteriales bacterium]MCW8940794.1 thiamine-phosphate kinase [Flavobacteriales bacterium]MCW8969056.1 thiamine-phosphate kinase [Flavobacteriales bacterium]
MFEDKNNPKEIENLGEFGLINHLTSQIKLKNPTSIKGVGDDAAVIAPSKNKQIVVTTDMLVEGIHFDLIYTPFKHLGYKAVTVNLSDVYAMNAVPTQITVSIAVSNKISIEALEELYAGMLLACEIYGVDLVGGDTTSSNSGLIISITAVGEAEKKEIVYRNGAKENDLICVSGDLGGAFMGLQLLEREKQIFNENPAIQPDFSGYDYVLERQLKPEPRQDVIEMFKELGVQPTAMIDISDGLSSEIIHICTQSGVGCTIYEDKLPIDPLTVSTAEEMNLNPSVCALNGGEDYELLFTISLEDYEKIKEQKRVAIIGHITSDKGKYEFVSNGDTVHELTAQGWNAILKKEDEN